MYWISIITTPTPRQFAQSIPYQTVHSFRSFHSYVYVPFFYFVALPVIETQFLDILYLTACLSILDYYTAKRNLIKLSKMMLRCVVKQQI